MSDLDLDALEALLAKATPAPWTHFPDVAADDAANSEARVCYTRDGETCEWCTALAGTTDDAGAWTPETLARWNADARLIAAMRNALPALIARVRKADALAAEHEADRWRLAERIEREHRPTWYGAHADREDEPGRDAGWVCHGCGEGVAAASPEPESGRDAIPHDDGCVWRMAREALDADGAPNV